MMDLLMVGTMLPGVQGQTFVPYHHPAAAEQTPGEAPRGS